MTRSLFRYHASPRHSRLTHTRLGHPRLSHPRLSHPRAGGDLATPARYKIPIRQPSVRWGVTYAGMAVRSVELDDAGIAGS